MLKIGQVVEKTGISADTLRYYEKIALMPRVSRNDGGVRLYQEKDLSRLRFIRRAQKMGFSLNDIASLLTFRENPQEAKPQVQEMAVARLQDIEHHLEELRRLRDELHQLTNRCGASADSCPILESFECKK